MEEARRKLIQITDRTSSANDCEQQRHQTQELNVHQYLMQPGEASPIHEAAMGGPSGSDNQNCIPLVYAQDKHRSKSTYL